MQRLLRTAEHAGAPARRLQRAPIARKPDPATEAPPSPEVAERQAHNAYPKNPHAAALQKKMILGTITPQELSELRGIASFPDNPRAAALYARQDAGTALTPAEQDELRGYFSQWVAQHHDFEEHAAPPGGSRENPRAAALRAKQSAGPLSREEQAELQGFNGYPDNPHAAALAAKRILGTITKDENAELQGFDTYPHNRRAAVLLGQQLRGEKLTRDEESVLHDEFYVQAMGEFLIRLERKYREGRLHPEQGSVLEYLRRDPRVRKRAFDILRSGGPAASVIDD